MARVNVYMPDDLAERARAAGLNISGLTQDAVRRALEVGRLDDWLDSLRLLDPVDVDPAAIAAAITEAKDEFESGV